MDEKEAEARPLINGKHFSSLATKFVIGRAKRAPHWGVQSRFHVIYNWRASEASETLSGLFNRESYIIYILWYVQILFL